MSKKNDKPDESKIQDAGSMEPLIFCSKYNGQMKETDSFFIVGVDDEHYLWRKDNGEFISAHKGTFDPVFMEKVAKCQKRFAIGMKYGEFFPSVEKINATTPELFAKDNETTVFSSPDGNIKQVLLDDVLYTWINNVFTNLQVKINPEDYSRYDDSDSESTVSDSATPESSSTEGVGCEADISFVKELVFKTCGLHLDSAQALEYIRKMIIQHKIDSLLRQHRNPDTNNPDNPPEGEHWQE